MGLHLPSALVGSVFAGCGFLLIHRELSYRHRLTTKWKLQEYAQEQWKEWRKSTIDPISDSAQQNVSSMNPPVTSAQISSTWNKGVAILRDFTSEKK